jgi:hypothetical protein
MVYSMNSHSRKRLCSQQVSANQLFAFRPRPRVVSPSACGCSLGLFFVASASASHFRFCVCFFLCDYWHSTALHGRPDFRKKGPPRCHKKGAAPIIVKRARPDPHEKGTPRFFMKGERLKPPTLGVGLRFVRLFFRARPDFPMFFFLILLVGFAPSYVLLVSCGLAYAPWCR